MLLQISRFARCAANRMARRFVPSTPVMENADPAKWRQHLFGLTAERWESLRGQSFWITGAGTGYGRCLACALAAAGAQVFLTGRRQAKLQESLEEMKSLKIPTDNCVLLPADVSNPGHVREACARIKDYGPALDGLVNNAAIAEDSGISSPLQANSLEYWEQMMKVNLTAPWLLTRTVFPHMLRGGRVRVLFISSRAGWAATPGFGTYNVSKAALNSLAHSMAAEYAHSFPEGDIQMNVLVPGEARTEMNQASTVSPYTIVSMALILLSHPRGGPNGRFFHQDGHHAAFGCTGPYLQPLIRHPNSPPDSKNSGRK